MVGRGENLRDIAKKYGVSATDIKRLNKLRRGKVKEGDALVIEVVERKAVKASTEPLIANTITAEDTEAAERGKNDRKVQQSASNNKSESKRESASAKSKKDRTPKTTTYKVKSGDSLEKIARKHGTTVEAIQKANGMSKGQSRINIGQSIKIPSKGSSVSKSKSSSKKKSKSKKRRRR